MPLTSLSDLRVIIGEDEQMLAIDMAQQLEALGAQVVATVASLAALEQVLASGTSSANAALLDVELIGGSVIPIVPRLEQAGISVVICSGYSAQERPAELGHVQWIDKPARAEDVASALLRAINARKEHAID